MSASRVSQVTERALLAEASLRARDLHEPVPLPRHCTLLYGRRCTQRPAHSEFLIAEVYCTLLSELTTRTGGPPA